MQEKKRLLVNTFEQQKRLLVIGQPEKQTQNPFQNLKKKKCIATSLSPLAFMEKRELEKRANLTQTLKSQFCI